MNRPRTAYTLIELSVAMTAGSTLLFLAASLLHQSLSLATRARVHASDALAINRLADEFRRDVHLATTASVISPEQVQLQLADGTHVQYQAQQHTVRRKADGSRQPSTRESYSLGDAAQLTFESVDQPAAVSLTIRTSAPDGQPGRLQRQVTATIGRRLQLQLSEVSR